MLRPGRKAGAGDQKGQNSGSSNRKREAGLERGDGDSWDAIWVVTMGVLALSLSFVLHALFS